MLHQFRTIRTTDVELPELEHIEGRAFDALAGPLGPLAVGDLESRVSHLSSYLPQECPSRIRQAWTRAWLLLAVVRTHQLGADVRVSIENSTGAPGDAPAFLLAVEMTEAEGGGFLSAYQAESIFDAIEQMLDMLGEARFLARAVLAQAEAAEELVQANDYAEPGADAGEACQLCGRVELRPWKRTKGAGPAILCDDCHRSKVEDEERQALEGAAAANVAAWRRRAGI